MELLKNYMIEFMNKTNKCFSKLFKKCLSVTKKNVKSKKVTKKS